MSSSLSLSAFAAGVLASFVGFADPPQSSCMVRDRSAHRRATVVVAAARIATTTERRVPDGFVMIEPGPCHARAFGARDHRILGSAAISDRTFRPPSKPPTNTLSNRTGSASALAAPRSAAPARPRGGRSLHPLRERARSRRRRRLRALQGSPPCREPGTARPVRPASGWRPFPFGIGWRSVSRRRYGPVVGMCRQPAAASRRAEFLQDSGRMPMDRSDPGASP